MYCSRIQVTLAAIEHRDVGALLSCGWLAEHMLLLLSRQLMWRAVAHPLPAT